MAKITKKKCYCCKKILPVWTHFISPDARFKSGWRYDPICKKQKCHIKYLFENKDTEKYPFQWINTALDAI